MGALGRLRAEVLVEGIGALDLKGSLSAVGASSLATTARMTAGTGITTGTGTLVKHSVVTVGNIIHTNILIDLTGLQSPATVGHIIGVDGVANCHLGQITAAVNGTVLGGRMSCLELPLTGEEDVDLFSATLATGTEGTAVTGLDEVELHSAGADWAMGIGTGVSTLAAMPRADDYLYLVNGSGAKGDVTYTGGRFLIEFWGYAA